MVMELLSGESLADRLRREPRMPVPEAASILLPVASALGAAHATGIVHRDLKPENIFLLDARGVKVLDFGIAKLDAAAGDFAPSEELTEGGTMLGTLCFMSPEVLRGAAVDHRTDIWALGLILYQCISGVLSTRASHPMQILRIITMDAIRPPQDLVPDLPADVAELVSRMLSRDVDARPADMHHVAAILARHTHAEVPVFGPPRCIVDVGDAEPLAPTEHRPPSQVRILAQQPTPHNLPLRRVFVGREGALSILDETLLRRRIASLFALAGTGKTALALEYAHRAVEGGAYPGGVWWILAEGSPLDAMTRLAAALRACVPALLEHVRLDASAEEQAEAARLALQSLPSPSLLVLDNASELGLEGRLPGGAVRVLATVRDRSWSLGEPCELEPLDAKDALALAQALAGAPAGDIEAAACNGVVQRELGGLAAAVEVAARAVNAWAGGWVAYEKYLVEQRGGALDEPRDRSQHYPRGLFAALDLSIDRCPPGSTERLVLVGAAMLAPDAVPRERLLAAMGVDTDAIKGRRALATLEGLGLLKVDRGAMTLSMHRLVHRRLRERFAEYQWRILTCVRTWLAETVSRSRAPMDEIDARRGHVEEALEAAERLGLDDHWLHIANDLARHFRYRGQYEESLALSARAMEKIRSSSVPLDQMVVSLSNLALALQAVGRPEEATPLLEEALALLKSAGGPDDCGWPWASRIWPGCCPTSVTSRGRGSRPRVRPYSEPSGRDSGSRVR